MRKLTQLVLLASALVAAPAFAEMKIAVLNYQMALLESDAAKRYAVLSILERVRWEMKPGERISDFDLGDVQDTDKIKANDAPALLEQLQSQAIERAMQAVTQIFIEKLGDFKDNLKKFAAAQRGLLPGGRFRVRSARGRSALRQRGEQQMTIDKRFAGIAGR